MEKELTEFLKHSVYCEYFGNGICEEADRLLDMLYYEIKTVIEKYPYISSKEKYTEIIDEISSLIEDFCYDIDTLLEEKIEEISDVESNWLLNFMASIGTGYSVFKGIASKIKFMPYAENGSYKDVSKTISAKIIKNTESSLKNAYLLKEPVENAFERISAKTEQIISNLNTEIKTFNTASFRAVDNILYKKNNQKVKYIAVLDTHTCLLCGSNHGLDFDIDKAPQIPLHHNCRCSLVPVEIAGEEIQSYKDFIESLSDEDKKDILGKSRYELYKKGIPVSSFVDSGKILTLDELKFAGLKE